MSEEVNSFWMHAPIELSGAQGDTPLRYWKDALACGSYVHPTQKYPKGHAKAGQSVCFSVDRDDLAALCGSYSEMASCGDEPPVVKDHAENSDNTLGYIKAARISPENPDRLQLLHEFTDPAARDVALRNKVSVKLQPNYRMSNGKVLSLAISHVATTPKPVITQQSDWAIAAARGSECDDAPVLFLTASSAHGDNMPLDEKTMKRIKALAPNATEDDALDLLLSTAESEHREAAKVKDLEARLAKLEKLPGAVELSAARMAELDENFDTFIELQAVKNQWPDACKAAIKKQFAGDAILLSRDSDGEIPARQIIEAVAPFIAKGVLGNAKEKTPLQLSREVPSGAGDESQAPAFDENPLIKEARRLSGQAK